MENIQIQTQLVGLESQSNDTQLKTAQLKSMPIFSFLDNKSKNKSQNNQRKQLISQSESRKDQGYNIEILSQKTMMNQFVIYQIKITQGNQYWVFQTRFSLLHGLNDKISKTIRQQLPKFPAKKLFGNLEQEFLQKRQENLSNYLKALFQVGTKDHAFKEFLRQSRSAATLVNDPNDVRHFNLDA